MDSTQLVQIRKDFYKTIRKRAEAITGIESKELHCYRQAYERELNHLGCDGSEASFCAVKCSRYDSGR